MNICPWEDWHKEHPDEPCWGEVEHVDDVQWGDENEYEPLYACKGHAKFHSLNLTDSAYVRESCGAGNAKTESTPPSE